MEWKATKAKRTHEAFLYGYAGCELSAFCRECRGRVYLWHEAPRHRLLAEKTLDELGLAPLRERHPNTLSGGQKQRLATAISMVCGKELLVFDEPTSGLDYDSMVRLAVLIRHLSDSGKIIFIVTHDYEFVCRTCTRVLHLDGGRIQDDLSMTETLLPTMKKIFDVR